MNYRGYDKAYDVYFDIQKALLEKIKGFLEEMGDQVQRLPFTKKYRHRFMDIVRLLWGTLSNCLSLFDCDIDDALKYYRRRRGCTV